MVDPATAVQLHRNIDPRWIQRFTDRFRIVCRSSTGSSSLAPAKLEGAEKNIAAHLGKMSGKLLFGLWDEQDVGNANEAQVLNNVSN